MLSNVYQNCAHLGIMYLMWISIHYTSSHLYTNYCTPMSITGYVLSPFLVNTPPCQGLRWGIVHGAEAINSMWLLLGTWFASKLMIRQGEPSFPFHPSSTLKK